MPTITIFSFVFMLLFFLRSERFNDKLIKREDELLQLADKDDYFMKKRGYLRDDELDLFDHLQKIVGDKYHVFPQIHLSDLLYVKNGIRDHENLYQVLGQKSVDYVIFSKKDMVPLVAIELNGASHLQFNRQNRDKLVKSLLTKAGVKFFTIQKDQYLSESTSNELLALLRKITSL